MSDQVHARLFERVIDIIYGEYDPAQVSAEQQEEYTNSLKERLSRWKMDSSYRKIIGPLQPAYIFSRMAKVPINVVEEIASDLELLLPKEVDISEFSIDEIPDELWESLDEETLDVIAEIENAKPTKPFEFVDLTEASTRDKIGVNTPHSMSAISYLEGIIEKIKAGKVHSMTVVALLNDGKASLWIPGSVDEDEVSEIYDPIIEALKIAGPLSTSN